ncbi:gliding motility-associated C-terminal domain-containing protein [Hymenobacter daecheongensis DSM 21074]|uniref:Gliding motility-associated C-terminal domain-containing protein n=1 Tax=Hymenobacter daecheongensis DSM 21074 TaxID=1121955 RepID=A0A1M6FYQ3_9BACT|nr:gliding motility-associated C-terminal domain-containing protein [Hymenobacter daecheongensis]SHJ02843.1 gliding motility-associated C-terminal domain-containing protein [Hymenobacter daecheongensis DSM 21074]
MNLSLLSRSGNALLVLVLSMVVLLGVSPAAWATHIRAGDIQATSDPNDPRRFTFKLVLYTDVNSPADTPEADIFFGDGTYAKVPRRDKTLLTGAASDSYLNTYFFEHTYNAPKPLYVVSFIGENRKTDLVNIPNARDQTFYIYTSVTVDPAIAFNQSPILNNPALNKASRQQVFVHNPGASDADGDSLAYELRPSQQANLQEAIRNGNNPNPTNCTGFVYPHLAAGGAQVAYNGPPVGVPGAPPIFVQDGRGTIVWNSPEALGDYNVAFVVREYRRTGTRMRLIGEVVRDMQITVRNANNLRPILTVPKDICVVAGTSITKSITATDPNNDPITLTAFGGILPPATFTITPFSPPRNPPVTRGIFRWTPTCANIAAQPYQVVFKATDVPPSSGATPLADELSWRIRVVGPAPQNVRATQVGTTAVLNWDAYACQNPGARLHIYRKEGCTITPVDTCQTGIVAGSGFVKIIDLPVGTRTFTDDRNGLGLERGKTYSYRLYVEFALPTGGASLASREACLTLDGKPALFTNVTVDRTSPTNGQLTVRWTKPVAGASATFNSPRYDLFRSSVRPNPVFRKITATPLAYLDTTFIDQGRNTQDSAYVYRLDFLSNSLPTPGSPVTTEVTGPASSVRLEAVPDPATLSISLSWTHNVPWDNSTRPVIIYRRDGTGSFVQIATAATTRTGGTYVDRGTTAAPLRIGGNYCYYIRTDGTYGSPDQHLINLSQERCVRLVAVPCTPVLSLKQVNCDSLQTRLFDLETTPTNVTYSNFLSWTLGSLPANCSRGIRNYNLYYSPNANPEASLADYRLLATVNGQRYTHNIPDQTIGAAGCYYVVAVDSAGTASAPSNIACKDNCQLFLMPNIFTPNADGKNDKLRPKIYSPIRSTKFQVFNRWGVKIYESSADPLINWDGGGPTGESSKGPKVTEGVYYYLAEVEFADLAGTKRTYKGWVEITR